MVEYANPIRNKSALTMSNMQSNQFSFTNGMTEDELLMQALEESAKLHQTTIDNHLCSRSFQGQSQSGMQLLQLPIFNQFHPQWNPLISKYSTPSAICGYTAIACARLIAASDPLSLTKEELQQKLCDVSAISGHVEHSMRFIHDCRRDYIKKNFSKFPAKSEDAYLKAWVANYEVSDYLRHGCPPSERPNIVFVRFNQYPELDQATHEEHDRISDHERGFNDATILVETFCDSEMLLARPHLHRPSEVPQLPSLRAAVVDVNGHFACAAVCKDGGVLFNTMDGSSVSFPGSESTAVALTVLAAGCIADTVSGHEQEHAIAMSLMQNTGGIVITRHRGQGYASPDYNLNFFKFNTFLADVKLCGGCFYFEVEVVQVASAVQFGVCTEGFMPRADPMGLGVGDCGASWAVCGMRQLKWQGGESSAFGSSWAVGDIIGFALDMRTACAAVMSISVNGNFAEPNGTLFTAIDAPYLSPAFSGDGRFRMNFGDRPFAQAPPCEHISVHEFHRSEKR